MKKKSCFELGKIVKPQGLKGEVYATIDSDDPENWLNLDFIFIELRGGLAPFKVETIFLNKEGAIIKFEEIENLDQASELKGKKLFLPLELLPEVKEGQFYYHDIIGYEIKNEKGESFGKVDNIITDIPQPVLIFFIDGKEILAPFIDETIKAINHERKSVIVSFPDGLIEAYLE